MASSCAVRSPSTSLVLPSPPPCGVEVSSVEPGVFRRSRSRVFYDSEISTGTSWEFRDIQTSSPIAGPSRLLYHNNTCSKSLLGEMQLSVLRSPDTSDMRGTESPVLIHGVQSSSINFRGIPSPTKDDLGGNGSDGSRNSTGSSSGSHRSQDSGFSDSGESHPLRKNGSLSNSTKDSCVGQRSLHLLNNSNEQTYSSVSPLPPADANRNYLSHNRSVSFQVDQQPRYESPPSYQQPPEPPPSNHPHHNVYHERFYSVPVVPSPIPHICGKLGVLQKNGMTPNYVPNSCGSFPKSNCHPEGLETKTLNRRSNFGDLNGNEERSCVVYEDVVSQTQARCSPMCSQCPGNNWRSPSQHSVHSSISPGHRESGRQSGNHLGVPICSSTPKRPNGPNSRVTIMQKIDNFESLNKNKKCLDNNNNNSSHNLSDSSNNNSGGCLKNEMFGSGQPLRGSSAGSPLSVYSAPGVSSLSPEVSESQKSCRKVSCGGKKSSRLSLSGGVQSGSKTSLLSSGNVTTATVGFSCSGNKTVLQRGEGTKCSPQGHQRLSLSKEGDEEVNNNLSNSSQVMRSKWENLPKGYKRVAVKGLNASLSSEESSFRGPVEDSSKVIIVKSHFDNDAMRLWLHELRSQTESECLHLLQTKTIGVPESGAAVDKSGDHRSKRKKSCSVVDAIHGISSPMMSIKNVERMASVVSGEFAKICKNIEFGFLSQVPSLVLALISHVEEFLREFQGSPGFGNLEKIESKLCRCCRRLNRAAENMIGVMGSGGEESSSIYAIIEPENCGEDYQAAVNEVVGGIVTVGNLFSQVVDLRLTRDLSCILETIEKGGIPSKVALKSFATILAEGGNHLCRLASEIRTVRGLLGVILDATDDYDKIISLRCLATILCVGEAVKDFDRAGGFEIVADFMYEQCYPLDLKIEAVSVLTQATDPWIDLESSLYSLGTQLEKIVVSLTCLIDEFKTSEESFLLVVAAISNLTFLEVSSIGILRRCNTVAILLDAVESSASEFSVFVLDHIATILANMAGVESCRPDIVKAGGVHALLDFLQRRPTPSKESASEIMACERVQQKSTIAISRLCSEEGVAKFILERGGIHRLVGLSRNEKERNYSDGVLIAALATLRKIISVCGEDVVKGLEAEDLIQPRLLDSFLLYSSRQESYV